MKKATLFLIGMTIVAVSCQPALTPTLAPTPSQPTIGAPAPTSTLVAPTVTLTPTATNTPAPSLNMVFVPESEKLIEATKEYQNFWDSDGKRIAETYERLTGLKFADKTIPVIVTEGVSQPGSENMPMKLRAGLSTDNKKLMLLNVLGIRLLSPVPATKELDAQRALFLILYDVWVDLYGKTFADNAVKVEKGWKGVYDYESAWNWALSFSAEQRASQFREWVSRGKTQTGLTPTPTLPPPTATKVWTGGTFPVETSNLIINYPDFLDRSEASKQAEILQKAYDAYLALFGKEVPYGGKKITVNFDPKLGDISYAGNPIRMGTDSEIFSGRVNPPTGAYYYLLVGDFTAATKTQAARYIDLNSAMAGAFSAYFSYYFAHEVLQYSAADIQWWDDVRATMLDRLAAYESQKIDPYSLEWKHHTDPQYYFTGMLFRISDQCGWGVWPQFFALARSSGNPGLPSNSVDQLNDMRAPVAKKAFSEFVALLSQACAQDLQPIFKSWRFDLP